VKNQLLALHQYQFTLIFFPSLVYRRQFATLLSPWTANPTLGFRFEAQLGLVQKMLVVGI
jgi:hypothetical protein